MMDLCFEHRGTDLDWHPMDVNVNAAVASEGAGAGAGDAAASRVLMTVTLPLAEIVTSFFDKLKSRSSGFASFECVFSVFTARGAPRVSRVLTPAFVFLFCLFSFGRRGCVGGAVGLRGVQL